MSSSSAEVWRRFEEQVVRPGFCTHCGLCVGLAPESVSMVDGPRGPLPEPVPGGVRAADAAALDLAWRACPGRGVPYPELIRERSERPAHSLAGPVRRIAIGHARDPEVRRRGASGGVITRTVAHLLETGRVRGVVVLRQCPDDPERARPVVARTPDEVYATAQSIYAVTPMLTVWPEIAALGEEDLAFVGLPDQVAAIRMLQAAGDPVASRFRFLAGPYVGTNMLPGAIRAFLRSRGVPTDVEITRLAWRAGEWPGYLEVHTADGGVHRAKKFYYNYLIPFFIAPSCLQTPDFTNELTDLSVGDAWSPRYENRGGGHSVVVARSRLAETVLDEMIEENELSLEAISIADALAMHGHMLDLKKRGAFIRLERAARREGLAPEFGYRPREITAARRRIETVLGLIFAIGRTPLAREIVIRLPLPLVGRVFDVLRKTWKCLSKPTKRRGLADLEFVETSDGSRFRELTRVRETVPSREPIEA